MGNLTVKVRTRSSNLSFLCVLEAGSRKVSTSFYSSCRKRKRALLVSISATTALANYCMHLKPFLISSRQKFLIRDGLEHIRSQSGQHVFIFSKIAFGSLDATSTVEPKFIGSEYCQLNPLISAPFATRSSKCTMELP